MRKLELTAGPFKDPKAPRGLSVRTRSTQADLNARIKQLARDVADKCLESPRAEVFDRADWHARAFALEIEQRIRMGVK